MHTGTRVFGGSSGGGLDAGDLEFRPAGRGAHAGRIDWTSRRSMVRLRGARARPGGRRRASARVERRSDCGDGPGFGEVEGFPPGAVPAARARRRRVDAGGAGQCQVDVVACAGRRPSGAATAAGPVLAATRGPGPRRRRWPGAPGRCRRLARGSTAASRRRTAAVVGVAGSRPSRCARPAGGLTSGGAGAGRSSGAAAGAGAAGPHRLPAAPAVVGHRQGGAVQVQVWPSLSGGARGGVRAGGRVSGPGLLAGALPGTSANTRAHAAGSWAVAWVRLAQGGWRS